MKPATKPFARIASYSSGDARSAYNVFEVAATLSVTCEQSKSHELTEEIIQDALQKRILLYDKAGEEHYNLISALHKSVRNSDPDAALYWLGRMIEAGEDPLYIARRVVRMAVEDIGLAEPNALALCMAARDAVDFIGMPEGNLALAQAVVYLSVAPKSNALYTAYGAVQQDMERTVAESVPLAFAQRAHLADERPWLRQGLSIRTRHRRQSRQHAMSARKPARSHLLSPDKRRNRKESASASKKLNGSRHQHPAERQTSRRVLQKAEQKEESKTLIFAIS